MNKLEDIFLETKEYRRFAEFCDACRKYRYVGLCYGSPGVGKTESAKHYAKWDLIENYVRMDVSQPELANCRSVYCVAPVMSNPRRLLSGIDTSRMQVSYAASEAYGRLEGEIDESSGISGIPTPTDITELIIIDEAERLKMLDLEQARDIYDRGSVGLVLIGMPGIEKRLSRYPQLYSRVGFVHHFRSLSNEEMKFILQHKWQQLGLKLKFDDFTDSEAIASVTRITGGNFRLLHRLFTQIERIMKINELKTVTNEVVEAAREHLIIGSV